MMRKTGILTLLFVVISSTFGCGSASSGLATNKAAEIGSRPLETADTETALADKGAYAANTAASSVATQSSTAKRIPADKISLDQTRTALIDTAPTDRKIIRNADLSLESESPEETQRRITAIAESNGGFVVESQQTSSDVRATKRDIVSMSVRVPSQKFADTLDQIRNASERVVFETVKGDDVTEEFIDVEARLKAKKALEQQFVEIMKRANNVEDALNVQSQLGDVRSEIERIEGRKRFLENQSSLSTIKIKLQTPTVFSASSSGFSHRLSESFATGFDFALNFVLGLVTLAVAVLPFAIFVGLPVFFGFRYFWKRQGLPKSVSEIAKEELKVT